MKPVVAQVADAIRDRLHIAELD